MPNIPLPTPTKPDIFSFEFGRRLYRSEYDDSPLIYNTIEDAIQAQQIQFGSLIAGSGDDVISANPESGFWIGKAKWGDAPFRVDMTGKLYATAANITGTINASVGTIGGFDIGSDYVRDAADSMGMASTVTGGDDIRFWAGDTFANRATSDFRVTEAGAVTASNITVTGGDVAASVLSGTVNSARLNVADRGWKQTCAFSVTDADTVSWAAGSFIASDGTTYSIGAGNTGNMAAKTYVYLDTAVSTTAYQTTTTASTAVGAGKVLIAVCQNATNEATFMVMDDNSYNIDAANIVTGSITGNEIAASTITAGKLSVSQLSAIAADLGAITAGTVTGATIRTAASGTRFTMDSTSFQGINSAGAVVFEIIISGVNAGDVIMGDDATGDYAIWDNSAGTFSVFADNIPTTTQGTFGGDGSDGALSISSGTTTIDLGSANYVVKNYTSISITGTGVLAFSNPHANGTLVVLKSQGNVTITSTATRAIDLRLIGADGGAAVTSSTSTGGKGGDGGGTLLIECNGALNISGTIDASGEAGANGSFSGTPVDTAGNDGNPGNAILFRTDYGRGGKSDNTGSSGGAALAINSQNLQPSISIYAGFVPLFCGAGGGSGGIRNAAQTYGGGGGGGAGGSIVILYKTLTANTGTYTVTGGSGGTGGGSGSGGGGAGAACVGVGTGSSSQNGVAGADGFSLVIKNTMFA